MNRTGHPTLNAVITLDATLPNKYARQPDKLRAWQSASRVERAPQREKQANGGNTGGTVPP